MDQSFSDILRKEGSLSQKSAGNALILKRAEDVLMQEAPSDEGLLKDKAEFSKGPVTMHQVSGMTYLGT
jgi:hypothetical protein